MWTSGGVSMYDEVQIGCQQCSVCADCMCGIDLPFTQFVRCSRWQSAARHSLITQMPNFPLVIYFWTFHLSSSSVSYEPLLSLREIFFFALLPNLFYAFLWLVSSYTLVQFTLWCTFSPYYTSICIHGSPTVCDVVEYVYGYVCVCVVFEQWTVYVPRLTCFLGWLIAEHECCNSSSSWSAGRS